MAVHNLNAQILPVPSDLWQCQTQLSTENGGLNIDNLRNRILEMTQYKAPLREFRAIWPAKMATNLRDNTLCVLMYVPDGDANSSWNTTVFGA